MVWRDGKHSKYERWYDSLMEKARNRNLEKPYEKHHIRPVALGGKGSETVRLTIREHFIAHLLLTKFTCGRGRYLMLHALWRVGHSRSSKLLSTKQIETARRAQAAAMRGSKRSAETRTKISAALKGRGTKHTPQACEKIRAARQGTKHSPERCEKISAALKGKCGRKHSEESRMKTSAALRGRKKSAETRERMKIAWIARKEKMQQDAPPLKGAS